MGEGPEDMRWHEAYASTRRLPAMHDPSVTCRTFYAGKQQVCRADVEERDREPQSRFEA